MADNYLEKKMDDYRRGVSNPPRRSVASPPRVAQTDIIQPLRVALLIADSQFLESLVATLRKYQHKVAFAASDPREGTRLAQSHGALFIPVTSIASPTAVRFLHDTVISRWSSIDAVITDLPFCINELHGIKTILFAKASPSDSITGDCADKIRKVILSDNGGIVDYMALSQTALLLLSPLSEAISSVIVSAD